MKDNTIKVSKELQGNKQLMEAIELKNRILDKNKIVTK